MAKDWEYAKATKWIAEHGGTQKALETIRSYYMKQGFKKGAASKNSMLVLVGASCLVAGAVGKSAYDKFVREKVLSAKADVAEQAEVKKAEEELETAMKQEVMAETAVGDTSVQKEEPVFD